MPPLLLMMCGNCNLYGRSERVFKHEVHSIKDDHISELHHRSSHVKQSQSVKLSPSRVLESSPLDTGLPIYSGRILSI